MGNFNTILAQNVIASMTYELFQILRTRWITAIPLNLKLGKQPTVYQKARYGACN